VDDSDRRCNRDVQSEREHAGRHFHSHGRGRSYNLEVDRFQSALHQRYC
jgi:hypothetical protein